MIDVYDGSWKTQFTISVRPKQIRFRLSAEFRPFLPKFGFAETLKHLSVSDSVSAETYFLFRSLPETYRIKI